MSLSGTLPQGRLLALLILAAALAGLWAGPVSAYLDLLEGNAEATEQKTALLARYRGLVESASAENVATSRVESDLLLPEIPDSQALAMLQERLKGLAEAAQVQIQGLQVLKLEALPGAVRVGVRVRASGDAAGLGRLLHGIEAARPVLVGDNLQIQSRMLPAAAPNGTPAATPLDFQLDVAAFKAGASS